MNACVNVYQYNWLHTEQFCFVFVWARLCVNILNKFKCNGSATTTEALTVCKCLCLPMFCGKLLNRKQKCWMRVLFEVKEPLSKAIEILEFIDFQWFWNWKKTDIILDIKWSSPKKITDFQIFSYCHQVTLNEIPWKFINSFHWSARI